MNSSDPKIPDFVHQARKRTREFIQNYLDHRKEDDLVGEFLDNEGCQLGQYGLGGTSFLLALKNRHDIDGRALITAEQILFDGIDKSPDKYTKQQQKLLKDVPRIPSKSILLALCNPPKRALNQIITTILENGIAQNLIKPDIEYNSTKGDIFVSCYFLQIAHISNYSFQSANQKKIETMLFEIAKEMKEGAFGVDRKLFLSTTLCLYDFDEHITYHRKLLGELYKSDVDWTKAFSTDSPFSDDSPFLDIWFPDGSKEAEKNRYLRIPFAYVAMSSIYAGLGSEKAFFKFKPVEKMVEDITKTYASSESGNRSRSAAYYLFFANVLLYPETYFSIKKAGLFEWILNRLSYSWSNLTKIGVGILILIVLGLIRFAVLAIEYLQAINTGAAVGNGGSQIMTLLIAIVIGILTLMKSTKK